MRKSCIYTLGILISFLLLITTVRADENYMMSYEIDSNYWAKTSTSMANSLSILTIREKGLAYSVDPKISITSFALTKDNDYLNSLTDEQLDYLRKIIYFGYEYEKTHIRYAATQELIWEYLNNEDVFWLSVAYDSSTKIDLEDEKQSILDKTSSYDLKPNFDSNDVSGKYLDEIVLTDTNNVLNRYEIVNSSKNIVSIEGNKLKIIVKEDSDITLRRKSNGLEDGAYSIANGLRIISLNTGGGNEEVIKINLDGGAKTHIKFQFLDELNKPVGKIKFQIKNDNQTDTYNTDNGYFLTDKLYEEGTYKVSILESPIEYKTLITETEFIIKKQDFVDDYINFISKFERKKGVLSLERFGELENKIHIPLGNMQYDLYAASDILQNGNIVYQKDEKIDTLYTDLEGSLTIGPIPLGSYFLKEINDSDYLSSKEIIPFTFDGNKTYINEYIISNHKPLYIKFTNENYTYELYNSKNEFVKTIDSKDNKLSLKYGYYRLLAKKDNKVFYKWEFNFTPYDDTFVFSLEDYLESISFDMPKTTTGK